MAAPIWQLHVLVTDLKRDVSVPVKGDMHVGGVMLKLVEMLEVSSDWSDHSFYWPDKLLWLSSSRKSLDHYGIQADARLWFTPMHKNIKIQLPDLQTPLFRINFSLNVFTVVIKLCKELGLRHPEELSLMKRMEERELKRNQGITAVRREARRPTGIQATNGSMGNFQDATTPSTGSFLTPSTTLSKSSLLKIGQRSPNYLFNANGLTPGSIDSLDFKCSVLIGESPNLQPNLLPKAKNISELARINSVWLDSSRSLMEQGVGEEDVLLLRYKFYNFFDLNIKDPGRLHFIYEQAKATILMEEVECSEDDVVLFAALQLHVGEKAKHPDEEEQEEANDYDVANTNYDVRRTNDDVIDDEVDNALMELQMTLEQCDLPNNNNNNNNNNYNNNKDNSYNNNNNHDTYDNRSNNNNNRLNGNNNNNNNNNNGGGGGGMNMGGGDITRVPILQDHMKCYRPRKFHLKSYKNYWFRLKDKTLVVSNEKVDEMGGGNDGGGGGSGQLMRKFDFTEDTFTASSACSDDKYVIKLIITSNKATTELWIRQDDKEQHVAWLSAFRTINRGSTMADTTNYEAERKAVISKLDLQKKRNNNTNNTNNNNNSNNKNGKGGCDNSYDLSVNDLAPDRLLPTKYLGRVKSCKQTLRKVLDSVNNVSHLSIPQSQLHYIKMWQSLPACGFKHFIIKTKNSKKEEILSIGVDRMTKSDTKKYQTIQTWMYKNIKTWSVNWDIKQVQVSFESEEPLAFQCLTADCKVIHEFLGGYIFLSMRSGDKSQTLDEELFHKLTGGWE